MKQLDEIQRRLLQEVADLHTVPEGAYNIRANGVSAARAVTANIDIVTKTDKPGIDVTVKPGTKNESVHIPVVLTESGLKETVYNDFHIGRDADVVIVAGCGIDNCGNQDAQHDGIHRFWLEPGARVKYVEKHYGGGEGTGERIMNPQTVIHLEEGAYMEMDTSQIRGIDSTHRETTVDAGPGAEIVVLEKLMTHGKQQAVSDMTIHLNGDDSRGRVISRSVAQEESRQVFHPNMEGNARCFGHVQCDTIIMGSAKVASIPAIIANHVDAQLIHEAAIGRIAGDQLLKLLTLGLSEEEAEERILAGFLK